MESLPRAELGKDSARPLGAAAGGGCISAGQSYETGRGHVFTKINAKSGAPSSTPPHHATSPPHYATSPPHLLYPPLRLLYTTSHPRLALTFIQPCH
ncbi:unnamed protein product [Lampetra fluviatilis]